MSKPSRLGLLLLLVLLTSLACGPAPTVVAPSPPTIAIATTQPTPVQAVVAEPKPVDSGAPGPIPVTAADKPPPPTPDALAKPPVDDIQVYRVPVGTSAVRGKASALVTLVEAADFQCPYCGRAAPVLKQLEAEYGDRLRVVFEHNPLPFHQRAEPAAQLALEARAQRGDKGFWAAHDLLFAKECSGSPKAPDRQACMDAGATWMDHQLSLDEPDLLGYAKALGLDVARVAAAIAAKKHAATIADDQHLAGDLGAHGTPTFFINGRIVVGANPIEKFRALIDEEMPKAAAMVKAGTPAARVYDKIMASARTR